MVRNEISMKKSLLISVVIGLTSTALANALLWGTVGTVTCQGVPVATSKSDPFVGAFAQLISVGANGVIDPLVYSGNGVSGDDVVLDITFSYGGSFIGTKDGKFKFIDGGLVFSQSVYVRVYNEANENYNDGVSAAITGGVVRYYWESSIHTFVYDSAPTAFDDQWDFTGGSGAEVIPEPTTLLLFVIGGISAWFVRRKNRAFLE